MKKKDGQYMESDYDKGKEITVYWSGGRPLVNLDDLISWLKENREDAPDIETDWLIKVFVRVKNSTRP